MSRYWTLPLLLALGATLFAQDASTTTVQGRVIAPDGSPVNGASVTLTLIPPAPPPTEAKETTEAQGKETTAGAGKAAAATKGRSAGQAIYVAVTERSGDKAGHYQLTGIPSGTYDVSVVYTGQAPQYRKNLLISGAQQEVDFVLNATAWSKLNLALVTLFIVIVFAISVFMVRWNNISRPNVELLKAEVDKVRARFKSETGLDLSQGDPKTGHLWELLEAASDAVKPRNFLSDFLFWSRGKEITAWSRIYEFQRDSVELYPKGSLPMIRARLQAVELDLLDIDKTHAKTLAGNIKSVLDRDVKDEGILRAILIEALTYLNDENDSSFAQLVGWQTKAVWLVAVGCVLIVVLAFAVGNAVLFIAGATGGYLSRMARQLKRADVPTDYGASWTTLFLSPIMGALSGWFGILLIVVLANGQFAVLGSAFKQIDWGDPLGPMTLGLAFALGFSERLFDGIISSLEQKVDSDRQAATQVKLPSSSVAPEADKGATADGGDKGDQSTGGQQPQVLLTAGAPRPAPSAPPAAAGVPSPPSSPTTRTSDSGRKAPENYVALSRSLAQSFFRSAQDHPPSGLKRPPLRDFDTKDIWPWIGTWLKAFWSTDIEGAFVPAKGKHPFSTYPKAGEQGIYDLSKLASAPDGSIHIALAGDWGTGTDVSQQVADSMVSTNPELTIHLGDIYYVGTADEVSENCLGASGKYKGVFWRYGTKGSLALNGNHEMYTGGNAYFDWCQKHLGITGSQDKNQLASYFCLESPAWRIVAIDTGYNSDTPPGDCHLEQPLLDWLDQLFDPKNPPKATVVLSHHQWFSSFADGDYPKPASQIAKYFKNQTMVWLWGHEHRFAIYDRFTGPDVGGKGVDLQAYCRCIGHGGMPVEMPGAGYPDPNGLQLVEYWDGDLAGHKERFIKLKDNTLVGPNGYVQMTIQGATLTLEYWTVYWNDSEKNWKVESAFKESFVAGGGAVWDGTLARTIVANPGILKRGDIS